MFGNGIKRDNVPLMYSNMITDPCAIKSNISIEDNIQYQFLRGMVSCHGLTHVRGELVGDPLEIKIFNATKWVSFLQTGNLNIFRT